MNQIFKNDTTNRDEVDTEALSVLIGDENYLDTSSLLEFVNQDLDTTCDISVVDLQGYWGNRKSVNFRAERNKVFGFNYKYKTASTNTVKEITTGEASYIELEKHTSLEEIFIDIYGLFNATFADVIYYRLIQLYDFYKEDEDPGKADFSIDSLKTMLFFLYKAKIKRLPSITIDDSGNFHCTWKKGSNTTFILAFFTNRCSEFLYTISASETFPIPFQKSGYGHINEIVISEIQKNVFEELLY